MAQRHALIDQLYQQKAYAELVTEVDAQIASSEGTTWADSLHRYLYKYGRAHRKLKDAVAGTTAAERIYALVKARGKAAHELEALFDLSWTYYDAGEMKQCARVDSIAVTVADRDAAIPLSQRGRARQYLAFDYSVLGDHRNSAKWALQAIAQYEQADSIAPAQWAESYTAAGVANWHLGRIRHAEAYYNKALGKLGDGSEEAILIRKVSTYGNLGVLWQNAGDFTRAKNHYGESLRYSDRVIAGTQDQFTRDEAIVNRSRTYVNLATVYFQTGDDGRARELLDRAWKDRSGVLEADDPQLIAVKERFADLELNAGNLAKAQELMHAYALATEQKFGARSEEHVRAISKLGEVLARQERYAQADSLFTISITHGKASSDEATSAVLAATLISRSRMLMRTERWHEALEDLVQARVVLANLYDTTHYKLAQVDVLRAEAAFGAGDMPAAQRFAVDALRIVNDRARALRSNALPRAFPEPHILPDAVYWKVRSSMAMAGAAPSAQPCKEWSADLDLAMLALARNKAAVEDDASKLLLVAAQKRLFELAVEAAFASRDAFGMEAAAERFLLVSEARRSTLLKHRLNGFKGLRFARLPDSLATREQELIAGLAIGDGELGSAMQMLESEKAYATLLQELERKYPSYFALRYGEATVGIDEIRRRLLNTNRALVAYEQTDDNLYALLLTTGQAELVKLDPTSLDDRVRVLNAAIAGRDAAGYMSAAHQLYEQLIAPLSARIEGKELLIIPDGPLHLVNFECLLTAPSTPHGFKDHLLIRRHAMAYLLSATTAVQFTELSRDRARGVLALAPGFTDELKRDYRAGIADSALLDRDYLRLVRQPFAVRAAEGLSGTMHARLLLGAQATEQGFRSKAGEHGILHLGTHAQMNASNPMYSRLVLSKDGMGTDPDADGYLHAYEIYELDLRAQLAVLTACETGIGRDDGEGVRSLGYSFAYAGCPSLVMSLWSIDEKASSEIIARFYEFLADGLPKHMALRQAKLDHLASADAEFSLPYYWAGLVLVGDVEPVSMANSWREWLLPACGALLILAALLWWRKRKAS